MKYTKYIILVLALFFSGCMPDGIDEPDYYDPSKGHFPDKQPEPDTEFFCSENQTTGCIQDFPVDSINMGGVQNTGGSENTGGVVSTGGSSTGGAIQEEIDPYLEVEIIKPVAPYFFYKLLIWNQTKYCSFFYDGLGKGKLPQFVIYESNPTTNIKLVLTACNIEETLKMCIQKEQNGIIAVYKDAYPDSLNSCWNYYEYYKANVIAVYDISIDDSGINFTKTNTIVSAFDPYMNQVGWIQDYTKYPDVYIVDSIH